MSKILRYLIMGLSLVLLGLIIGFQLRGTKRVFLTGDSSRGMGKMEELIGFIEANYVEERQQEQLIEEAIRGIMDGLDPHSFYIPASEARAKEEQLEGGFDGIGVYFNILDDTIYIEKPLVGSPSMRQGIQAGDRIIEVEGKNTAGIGITREEVVDLLKGPEGSEVQIRILRRGEAELLAFTLKRERIPVSSVEYSSMIQHETGYIKISRFTENTNAEFREALLGLKEDGMKQLILDLRGNPGGYLSVANKMADEFLPSGDLIVSTIGRNVATRQEYYATSAIGAFEQGPLIILIDHNSASASEIVAGAVQDHDRGLIVGVRSFGKGLVQVPKSFEDESAIRLVISKYYTPSGRCIQKPYQLEDAEYQAELAHRYESGELFDESKLELPDSLVYQTASGRPVYGGGGIYPDAFAPIDTSYFSQYLTDLQVADFFRLFSFYYVDRHPELLSQYPDTKSFVDRFQVSQNLINQFIAFASERGVIFDPDGFRISRTYILNRIAAYIGRHIYGNDDAYYPIAFQIDHQLNEALKLLPVAADLEGSGHVNLALRQ